VSEWAGLPTTGYVADTMILAMFIDAGHAALLSALAAGRLFVTPAVIDPAEAPPFIHPPTAEFARGTFYLQQRQGHPVEAVRFHRRVAFYLDINAAWRSALLSIHELQQAEVFVDAATWRRERVKRIGRGEAECAAVAVMRGWTLWSDDAAIIALLAALYPERPVERISDLLARAVREGLIACEAAVDLYNDVFKGRLGLWTTRTLACHNSQIVVR
jgi:hypothetical protein